MLKLRGGGKERFGKIKEGKNHGGGKSINEQNPWGRDFQK